MNGVNKTLYIPLYGKAYVSRKGIFLDDKKAEEIWEAEGFALKGKSKSKWLAYYMGIRAAVFDNWVRQQITNTEDAVVIHIGCGMDSRVLRVSEANYKWYDVDFTEVIEERKRYYFESYDYHMIAGDVRDANWLASIPEKKSAIVVMEGVSMYLTSKEIHQLTTSLCAHFEQIALLMDCYTVRAAKMSKYKNPINDVGVIEVFGVDNPELFQHDDFVYVKEHTMTPPEYIDELSGVEKYIFEKLYAGNLSKKLYRLFEYRKFQNANIFNGEGIIGVDNFGAMSPDESLGYMCSCNISVLQNGQIEIRSVDEVKDLLESFSVLDIVSANNNINNYDPAYIMDVALKTASKGLRITFQTKESKMEFWDAFTTTYDSINNKRKNE